VPKPTFRRFVFDMLTRVSRQFVQGLFRQSVSRRAVGASIGRAWF
jgi:hypothetical protein